MPRRIVLAGVIVLLGTGLACAQWQWGGRLHGPGVHLGLRLVATTAQLRKALGVKAARGALVIEVEERSPAAKAGLRAGDVITKVAGRPVGDTDEVLHALDGRQAGDVVALEYVRRGRVEGTSATLAAAPGGPPPRFGPWGRGDLEREMRRLREWMEDRWKDLEERLRRLERDEGPERTGAPAPESRGGD
jgi:membrane-associated protease RseP (regulator of RpoE activity)